jgi:SPP1 family predicted phage head-tail adaptor
MRHQVAIKRKATTLDSRGQVTGSDSTVIADVPCSIEQLNGLERIRARKQYSDATHRVRMHGDPDNLPRAEDYLAFGSRSLHIGAVIDEDLTGYHLELLCREDVQ